ncbi:MAG: DUF2163 domain-containing protein [Parvibaculaceae bacterium]|nr:DUF2163 domain-containing protein [Parvibaculaceae bacterium]
MKNLSPALAGHLAGGTTTLATCWKIVRSDGVALGFTDCDVDISFDGVTHEAAAGMSAGAMESSAGLAVDNLDVAGALQSEKLNERDLAAGLFDNADVEIWRVNWRDVSQRVLMRKGTIGEVSRGSGAFQAEVRGLAHVLNQSTGRLHQYGCDATFGDARCSIDATGPGYLGGGAVITADSNRILTVSGINAYPSGFFTRGLLKFNTGDNAGIHCEVKSHGVSGGVVGIELWQEPVAAIAVGDGFSIRAGCDKQFSTCRTIFNNQINFRGFPHMPGNDFVQAFPASGGVNDGGSQNG